MSREAPHDYENVARRFAVLGSSTRLRVLAALVREFPNSTRDVDLPAELGLPEVEVRLSLEALDKVGLTQTFGMLDTYYRANIEEVRALMDLVWIDSERAIVH